MMRHRAHVPVFVILALTTASLAGPVRALAAGPTPTSQAAAEAAPSFQLPPPQQCKIKAQRETTTKCGLCTKEAR